jgi:hypothetical protein
VLARVEETISRLVRECAADERGPFAGASAIAEQFLRTWRTAGDQPSGPPLA